MDPHDELDEAEPEPGRNNTLLILGFSAFCLAAIVISAWIFRPGFRAVVYESLVHAGNDSLTRWAIDGLRDCGGARALALIALDEEMSDALRRKALWSLGSIPQQAEPAIPALVELQRRGYLGAPRSARAILSQVSRPAARYIASVIQDTSEAEELAQLLLLLGEINAQEPAVLPVLTKALDHPDFAVRLAAIDPILDLGPEAASSAESQLLRLIDDARSLDDRRVAYMRLTSLNEDNPLLLPATERILPFSDRTLKSMAITAINNDAAATPLLLKFLGDSEPHIRWQAALALAKRKDLGAEHHPQVKRELQAAIASEEVSGLRWSLEEALKALGDGRG